MNPDFMDIDLMLQLYNLPLDWLGEVCLAF